MPANKKQHTTPSPNPTAEESSSCQHLVGQTFHQQLREHIRSATQRVMEEIMREELTQFLGAEWGECCTERKGYRNGSYSRDLATTSGETRRSSGPQRSRRSVSHPHL